MKEIFEPQGVPVHSADLLPPPNGTDRHLYVSIGNYKNHERLASRPDVIMSAYLVTEAPVVEPLIYEDLRVAKRRFKRIYSCIDAAAITEFVGEPVPAMPAALADRLSAASTSRCGRGPTGSSSS